MPLWPGFKTWAAAVVSVLDLQTYITDAFGALHPSVLLKSADYTVAATDGHSIVIAVDASGAGRTITLYTAAGHAGARMLVRKTDTSANSVTVDGNSAETIDGVTTFVLWNQHDYVCFVSDGTNWQVESERTSLHIVAKTTTYTALVTDDVIEATSGTFTVTLHAANAVRRKRALIICNSGSGVLTIARAGSDTIAGLTSFSIGPNNSVILVPNLAATNWIVT